MVEVLDTILWSKIHSRIRTFQKQWTVLQGIHLTVFDPSETDGNIRILKIALPYGELNKKTWIPCITPSRDRFTKLKYQQRIDNETGRIISCGWYFNSVYSLQTSPRTFFFAFDLVKFWKFCTFWTWWKKHFRNTVCHIANDLERIGTLPIARIQWIQLCWIYLDYQKSINSTPWRWKHQFF